MSRIENLGSYALKGNKNPNTGKHRSEKIKKKISEKLKEYYKTHEHHWKGKHHTKESKAKITGKPHTFKINENFFENIDTEHKTYWLGFIMANGYVTEKLLQFSLNNKDEEHLKKFLFSLGSNYPINRKRVKLNGKVFVVSCISIRYKKLQSDLMKWINLINKSGLDVIRHNLLNHFIRGFFDGDGCFFFLNSRQYKNRWLPYHSCGFNITNSDIKLLKEIQLKITQKCGLNPIKIQKKRGTNAYYIQYNGSGNVYKFGKWLYKNSTIFLKRKKRKFSLIKTRFSDSLVRLGLLLE